MCVHVCVMQRVHMCVYVCARVRTRQARPRVRVTGVPVARVCEHAAWSTRIHEGCGGRARVCTCTALLDLARAYECAPPVLRVDVCLRARARARACVCFVRVRVHACEYVYVSARVGDDALQTRVKSRGGREFLCASRPVPLRLHYPQRGNPPFPAHVILHPSPSAHLPGLHSRPAYSRGAVSRVVAGG